MECKLCQKIKNRRNDKTFIGEIRGGYLFLADYQYYKGYSILISKKHVENFKDMKDRTVFLGSLYRIGAEIEKMYKPLRINYEILCNSIHHIHAHIIPRYEWEGEKNKHPIWSTPKRTRENKKYLLAKTV